MKVGILGCAKIALRSLIPAFRDSRDFQLCAVASRSFEKVRSVASEYGLKPYGSYLELLEDPVIDLVYIPLPNALHYGWIKESLLHGKHVLCEKSLGCSFAEVEELVNLARKEKRLLMESFQFRFHSQTEWVRNYIATGGLGEVRAVRAYFGFPPFPDKDNIRYVKELGGGALLDAGAYTVKCLDVFFPDEEFSVKGAVMEGQPDFSVDIFGGALLESQNGMMAQLSYGFDNFYQCGFDIWGSKGKLTSTRAYTAPKDHSPIIIVETPESGRQEIVLRSDDHFKSLLKNVARIIQSDDFEREYHQNLKQAKILNDIKDKATNG